MAIEHTLSIIKPDAVGRNVIGGIYRMLEEHSLIIVGAKMLHLSRDMAEELYAVHKGTGFYNDLIDFMTSGPVMVQVLEGESAIDRYRKLMGATKPDDADVGTIRDKFAVNNPNTKVQENAVHGSDSPETAAREIAFFFDDSEICPRTR
ncbi:MAG: nucleoside-diphosphate kinase [Thiotrichales bacterium]|nr:nucleoside-diphosphate kinase [Thiotrichales bacterium]